MVILDRNNLDALDNALIGAALEARSNAYAPYSKFNVGAALIASDGKVFRGCNVESADYTLTSHAEMVAIDSMIVSGSRGIRAIAIALRSGAGEAVPCGLCRQKLSEFAGSELRILCVALDHDDSIHEIRLYTLGEMLPYSFSSKNLE